MSDRAGGRVLELDGLRGFAIFLVLLCHFIGNSDREGINIWLDRVLWLFKGGWVGVDLFFVLSGFLIGGILLESRESPRYFQTFYLRRAHRILPVYLSLLALFTLSVCVLRLFPQGRAYVSFRELGALPKYLLFLQNFFGTGSDFQWKWFVVTWSLAVEEQFYLFAPMLVRFLPVRRLVMLLVALLFIEPVIRVASLHSVYGGLGWSVFGRADSMAWGMLGAIGWRTPRLREALLQNRKAVQWCCGIGFVGLVLWLKSLCMLPLPTRVSSFGLTWIAVSFGCLLLLVISQPDGWVAGLARMSWLRFLGMISYCLYLVHMPINQFAHLLLLHKDRPHISDAAGIGVSAGALGLSLLVATLSWRYLEKPLIRRGHAYSYWEPNAQMHGAREAVIGVSSQYSKV